MNWRKYFSLSVIGFRESLVYRVNTFTSILSSLIFLVLSYFVWKALAASGNLGSSLSEIMSYIILGQVVANSASANVENFIGDRIKKGTVVNELKRPISLLSQVYFSEFGKFFFNFGVKSLPFLGLGFFLVDIGLPSGFNITAFSLSLFLAFNLVFFVSYAGSMLIFWTKVEWSIKSVRNNLQKIFSGAMFPLYLLPDNLESIFTVLPFQAMVDGPVTIFQGATTQEVYIVLFKQLFWVIVFFIIAKLSYGKAKKKLTVQGG